LDGEPKVLCRGARKCNAKVADSRDRHDDDDDDDDGGGGGGERYRYPSVAANANLDEYLRSTAETVVVGYSLDATGAGHGHVTTLISEVDPDHGHRSHGCWCLGESALAQ